MTTPSVSKTVEQKELLCIAGGNAEWYSYFERQSKVFLKNSVQFSSLSRPTLCNLVDCSTPGLPVHHQLLEFNQTHVQ